MTVETHKIIRWVLTGAAFIAVVGSAGCSAPTRHAPTTNKSDFATDDDSRERQLPGDVEGIDDVRDITQEAVLETGLG